MINAENAKQIVIEYKMKKAQEMKQRTHDFLETVVTDAITEAAREGETFVIVEIPNDVETWRVVHCLRNNGFTAETKDEFVPFSAEDCGGTVTIIWQ